MAFIVGGGGFLAVAAHSKVIVLNCSSGEQVVQLELHSQTSDSSAEKEQKPSSQQDSPLQALCAAFSYDGLYLAVASSQKVVKVWRCGDWTAEPVTLHLAKPATALCFATADARCSLLVADRSGLATEYPILTLPDDAVEQNGAAEDKQQSPSVDADDSGSESDNDDEGVDGASKTTKGRLLLGHVSILLDLQLLPSTNGRQLVATSDRDEKIRISRYPQSFVIETFCLGHSSCVRSLAAIPCCQPQGTTILASGAADGTLRLWQPLSGECLATLPLASADHIEAAAVSVRKIAYCHDLKLLAASFEVPSREVCLVRLVEGGKAFGEPITLQLESSVWDVCFDVEAKLCVLLRNGALVVYRLGSAADGSPVEAEGFVSGLTSSWIKEALEGAVDVLLPALSKAPHTGNVEKYQERKVERQQANKRKRLDT